MLAIGSPWGWNSPVLEPGGWLSPPLMMLPSTLMEPANRLPLPGWGEDCLIPTSFGSFAPLGARADEQSQSASNCIRKLEEEPSSCPLQRTASKAGQGRKEGSQGWGRLRLGPRGLFIHQPPVLAPAFPGQGRCFC